jgi:hypothetical protein
MPSRESSDRRDACPTGGFSYQYPGFHKFFDIPLSRKAGMDFWGCFSKDPNGYEKNNITTVRVGSTYFTRITNEPKENSFILCFGRASFFFLTPESGHVKNSRFRRVFS